MLGSVFFAIVALSTFAFLIYDKVIKPSHERQMQQLEELISWFDSDDFDIEKAIEKFKEAEKLSNDIEKDLNNLKNEINIVKQKFD